MKNILIIEDDQLLLNILTLMLEDMECLPIGYEDAESALNYIKINNPRIDLVITDLRLPGMNGGEFSKELYKMKPKLPVIIISGFLFEIDTTNTNIIDIINKPIYIKTLQRLINDIGIKY